MQKTIQRPCWERKSQQRPSADNQSAEIWNQKVLKIAQNSSQGKEWSNPEIRGSTKSEENRWAK